MKKVLTLLLLGIMFISCGCTHSMLKPDERHGAIVRLHMRDGGSCSGTVISPTRILTAAHCVVEESIFPGQLMKTEHVDIRDIRDEELGVIAEVESVAPMFDLAVLSGNFANFKTMDIETDPAEINKMWESEDKIESCGYPFNDKFVCSPLTIRTRKNFGFAAYGWLYPGMSGGPVIDRATGKIIAVNTAVSEAQSILSPIMDIWAMLRIPPM